jgi:hypothetical protein
LGDRTGDRFDIAPTRHEPPEDRKNHDCQQAATNVAKKALLNGICQRQNGMAIYRLQSNLQAIYAIYIVLFVISYNNPSFWVSLEW